MLHRSFAAAGLALSVAVAAAGCQASTAAPTAQDAKQFLDEVNTTFDRLYLDANRAGWVAQNFITVDSEAMDARGFHGHIFSKAYALRVACSRRRAPFHFSLATLRFAACVPDGPGGCVIDGQATVTIAGR